MEEDEHEQQVCRCHNHVAYKWKKEYVMKLCLPGVQLVGMAASMTVKQWKADFAVVRIYFPPRQWAHVDNKTVLGLVDWAEQELEPA